MEKNTQRDKGTPGHRDMHSLRHRDTSTEENSRTKTLRLGGKEERLIDGMDLHSAKGEWALEPA